MGTRAHGKQAGVGSGQVLAGKIVDEADFQPCIDDAHAHGKRVQGGLCQGDRLALPSQPRGGG